MCGFTGFYLNHQKSELDLENIVAKMADTLEHRGPDDRGVWCDPTIGIALGHRRLSIVDLSPSGHQPMISRNYQYVIALNGEIYNHVELRNELESLNPDHNWNGHSDTETLLAGFEEWGVDKTLEKSIGMFAIALWNIKTKKLSLIRDRFGEKPLYYGWIYTDHGKVFAFGSELKALKAFPGFKNSIARDSLKQFFKYMYVPAPYSIYKGIYKLEPGSILSIDSPPKNEPSLLPHSFNEEDIVHESICIKKWYKFKKVVAESSQQIITNKSEATNLLEKQLQETIKLQSLADVPLGAFLSGGVDSSTIVAMMQKQSTAPVKTFTIGFDDAQFDESQYAMEVASHIGTEHYEMRVTSDDALSMIPKIPCLYDEPFADSSQIPTFFVSQAAKKEVTVSLSGDAGDELFGGYNRYLWAPRLWKKIDWMPFSVRKSFGKILQKIPLEFLDNIGNYYNLIRSDSKGVYRLGDKVSKTAIRLANVDSLDALYKSLVCEWPNADALVKPDLESASDECSLVDLIDDPLPGSMIKESESELRMMYWDTISYLPDDILCKVDRAAMGNSLETRVPFLDHRIVELAQKIPLSMKIKDGTGKSILRNILYKDVPRDLIERPKAGFGIPLGSWLRGPLRPWVEELLDMKRIESEGYLNAKLVNHIWSEHLRGTRDWSFKIWSVVIFQQWLESQN